MHKERQPDRYSLVKPCQKHASAEMRQLIQTVPRRPNLLFMGSVSQQPMTAQQRYGALLTSPTSQESLIDSSSPIPNDFL